MCNHIDACVFCVSTILSCKFQVAVFYIFFFAVTVVVCLFLLLLPALGTARVTPLQCVSTATLTPVNIKAVHTHIDFMCWWKVMGSLAQHEHRNLHFIMMERVEGLVQEECFMGYLPPLGAFMAKWSWCPHTITLEQCI